MNSKSNIVEVENLKKCYFSENMLFKKSKYVKAVDNVTFTIKRKEVFGPA